MLGYLKSNLQAINLLYHVSTVYFYKASNAHIGVALRTFCSYFTLLRQ